MSVEPLTPFEKIAWSAGRWFGAAARGVKEGVNTVRRRLGLGSAAGSRSAMEAARSMRLQSKGARPTDQGRSGRNEGNIENTSNRTRSKAPPEDEFGFDQRSMPGTDQRSSWLGAIIVVLSLVSGLATYLILTGLTPIQPRNDVVVTVLFANMVLVAAMIGVLSWQAFGLVKAWRQKIAGARLHVRIVLLFSIIAALPSLMLAISATTTFSRSLDNLFSRSTRQIVANSLEVANAYLAEHGQVIRNDIVNMAKDLDDAANEIGNDRFKLRAQLIAQAGLRELPMAYLIDEKGKIQVVGLDDVKVPYVTPGAKIMAQAKAGHIPLLLPSRTYRVAAITRLEKFPGRYLYVARRVNPKVIRQVRRTEAGVRQFNALRDRRGGMKLAHALMYFMISLTALLAAIWIGMWFAGRLVAPIRRLIGGAQQVSTGNLNIQLPIKRGEGDLRRLSQTFNHMTSELKNQRDALVTANEQLVERRVFMEAMLSGVSAGVIGLDGQRCITLVNRSAEVLLGHSEDELKGRPLEVAVPEFGELICGTGPQKLMARSQAQVTLEVDGVERTFAVRATQEQAGGEDQGWVVTFDDITELVAAQRTSAWADVAQRIAHEIKNPLTPIQLSAERIRRKYGKVIVEDREVFEKCTETIIRQVSDVARMVDEFSTFARMPKAEMAKCDLREVIREPVFLFEMGNSQIDFKLHLPDQEVILQCDRRLISQMMTNLVKNASEAIAAVNDSKDKPTDYRGTIETRLKTAAGRVMIEVVDNGIGLPKQNRGRLVEPYVTNREKGTGLGLAIVQKIVEQHHGSLALEDAPVTAKRKHGALVRVTLPLSAEAETGAQKNDAITAATSTAAPASAQPQTKDKKPSNKPGPVTAEAVGGIINS